MIGRPRRLFVSRGGLTTRAMVCPPPMDASADLRGEARAIADALGLLPHPEGGHYRETFRAPLSVRAPQGERAASTAIYFLLPSGSVSALHRVRSDEVWHHYDGDPVEVHTIDAAGTHAVTRLGKEIPRGDRPQVVVGAGLWQAAIPIGNRFALCGCTVAPGFDFADFEMPSRLELTGQFPQHARLIERLARR
jgi:predicted cupin superfamily sugar epimerase